MTHKNKKHLSDHMKPKLRDFILFKILKYSNWDEYNKNLFIVLTHPSWTKSDIDWITKDLKRGRPPFAENIKVMLKEDFLQMLKVQDKIKSKIDQLYNLVAGCLQKRDPKLREESLIQLKDIYEQAKAFLKFPLSQLKLIQLKGSFFNLD